MADRTKMHFCGPTGANAVDAAIKLCKTATGRGDIVSFQGGFHGTTHAGMALTGLVANKRSGRQRRAGRALLPVLPLRELPARAARDTCATNCIGSSRTALRDPNGGIPLPAAVIVEMVQGEGGVVPADREFVRRLRRAHPRARHPARGRRGADRLRSHGHLVRLRAATASSRT